MIFYFPPPYKDELLYSAVARFCVHCNKSFYFASNMLFGCQCRATVDLPRSLSVFAENTYPLLQLSAEEIINTLTLFPFYAAFVNRERANKAKEGMLFYDTTHIQQLLGTHTKQMALPSNLRYCRQCAEADLELYKETYWRRLHQLPCVFVCPEHKALLFNSTARYRPASPSEYADATRTIDFGADTVCAENVNIDKAVLLALYAREILNNYNHDTSQDRSKNDFRKAVAEYGYKVQIGYSNFHNSAFIDFYGTELIDALCLSNFRMLRGHLNQFLKEESMSVPAVYQIVLGTFFRHAPKPIKATPAIPFGQGPWRCPNPYAQHENEKPIKEIAVRKVGETYSAYAICPCGFMFSFRSLSCSDPSLPEVFKRIGFGPSFEIKAEELRAEGMSINRISVVMNIADRIVKRLLAKDKNFFEARYDVKKMRDESSLTEELIAHNMNGERINLNSDPNNNVPSVEINLPTSTQNTSDKRQPAKSCVDWAKRDMTICKIIEDTAIELYKIVPPVYVTKTKIFKESNINQNLIESLKMPLTMKKISEVTETIEKWRKRRIVFVANDIYERGQSMKKWKILYRAGILSKFVTEEINKYVDEIITKLTGEGFRN